MSDGMEPIEVWISFKYRNSENLQYCAIPNLVDHGILSY